MRGGLPASSEQEWALRAYLQQCPAVQGAAPHASNNVQHSARVTKSLNVSPAYATHFRSGIRELIQNWFDQCKTAASYATVSVQDLTPPSAATAGDVLLACAAGGRCCGYLSLSPAASGRRDVCDVRLCNYASTISMAAMTLGESSKRGQDSLAGFFGGGVKVEINRIMASGASVVYYTSNQEWSFKYEREHGVEVRLAMASGRPGWI
ncbi:hypothetical protein ABPG75_001316 [Micractinium tetrahymenae]